MTRREIVLNDIRQMMLSFLVSEGVAAALGSLPLTLAISVGTGLYYGIKIDSDIRRQAGLN